MAKSLALFAMVTWGHPPGVGAAGWERMSRLSDLAGLLVINALLLTFLFLLASFRTLHKFSILPKNCLTDGAGPKDDRGAGQAHPVSAALLVIEAALVATALKGIRLLYVVTSRVLRCAQPASEVDWTWGLWKDLVVVLAPSMLGGRSGDF